MLGRKGLWHEGGMEATGAYRASGREEDREVWRKLPHF